MRNNLLVFGRFADDPQGVLAAVHRLARMGVEFCLKIGTLELSVAPFADTKSIFNNSQFALRHDCSLAQAAGRT
jgi:hypothetical protein